MNAKVLQSLTEEFLKYFARNKNLSREQIPHVNFVTDDQYADDPFGKTAFYNPSNLSIYVYIPGRHIKDIIRSVAHECVHHLQNLRGDLKDMGEMGEGYAQSNKKMREMEKEAYLEGNMMFRDWTDTRKKDTLTESLSTRSIQVSERNHKIYFKLLERWNKK